MDELNLESVDRTIGVLLRGVICGYKHGVAAMKRRGGGSIISTASIAGIMGGGAPLIYCTCKAAVMHLARSAAMELTPFNIRSNAICPGMISTQLLSRAFGVSKEEAEPFREFVAERVEAGERIRWSASLRISRAWPSSSPPTPAPSSPARPSPSTAATAPTPP